MNSRFGEFIDRRNTHCVKWDFMKNDSEGMTLYLYGLQIWILLPFLKLSLALNKELSTDFWIYSDPR